MGVKAISHERENGIFYTPPILAEYLAKSFLPLEGTNSILDPAYGEGALLLAAERVYKDNKIEPNLQLFGCDIKPVNGLLKHLPKANLKKINFFKYSVENKFSTILMNPPYVRHHLQSDDTLKNIKDKFPGLNLLANSADLWAYFLIKSVSHLKLGGSIGAILPWSFLQADYARPLREFLTTKFRSIKVLALTEEYFQKAQERIVIVWLKSFGEACENIEIASSRHLDDELQFKKIAKQEWLSNKVHYATHGGIEDLLTKCKLTYGFQRFGSCADILIGVVTGADKFFIRDKQSLKELGINSKHLIPIISTTKEFVDVLNSGTKNLKRLIALKRKDYKEFRGLIQKGRNKFYHLRAHSMLRDPWYSVKIGKIPDAFFPYRISVTPFLLANEDLKCQSTNSVHRIYFKEVSRIERKWIHISLLSAIGQLSLEAASKTYGRGMLKIEPSSLKEALVIKRDDVDVNDVYERVLALLRTNDKLGASQLASSFIFDKLDIPRAFRSEINDLLNKLQTQRIGS